MKKKKIVIISIPVIVLLIIGGIALYFVYSDTGSKKKQAQKQNKNIKKESTSKETQLGLEFIRKIEIAEGYFPGIVYADNHFYVSYATDDTAFVEAYDQNFEKTGEKHQLKGVRADYQMVYGDGNFYIFGPKNLRKYDSHWNEIKSVSFFDNLPSDVAEGWPHGVDDMLFCYDTGSLYLGTAAGNMRPGAKEKGMLNDKGSEKKPDVPGNLYVQEYDQALELINSNMLVDVGNVVGSSIISKDGSFKIITSDKHWNDSSLIVIDYSKDWQLSARNTISAEPNVNEEFPMGVLFKDKHCFVAFHEISGDLSQPQKNGEPIFRTDVVLKIFDQEWKLVEKIKVTDDVPSSNLTSNAGRPHLVAGDKEIYVIYDQVGIEKGSESKVYVKEYLLD